VPAVELAQPLLGLRAGSAIDHQFEVQYRTGVDGI